MSELEKVFSTVENEWLSSTLYEGGPRFRFDVRAYLNDLAQAVREDERRLVPEDQYLKEGEDGLLVRPLSEEEDW